jgi:TPR repeat protein
VEQDLVEAARLYKLAAEGGFAIAQHNLECCYIDGDGVDHNDAEAVRWYRAATAQGYANAQSNLGLMYDTGRGVD